MPVATVFACDMMAAIHHLVSLSERDAIVSRTQTEGLPFSVGYGLVDGCSVSPLETAFLECRPFWICNWDIDVCWYRVGDGQECVK